MSHGMKKRKNQATARSEYCCECRGQATTHRRGYDYCEKCIAPLRQRDNERNRQSRANQNLIPERMTPIQLQAMATAKGKYAVEGKSEVLCQSHPQRGHATYQRVQHRSRKNEGRSSVTINNSQGVCRLVRKQHWAR